MMQTKPNTYGNILRLDAVSIRLGQKKLLEIDAEITPGNTLTVMGPSGSGKSSLLAFIAGFLDPAFTATGKIFLGDDLLNQLPSEKRRVGMLFQDALLFPHMSVYQNLAFAIPEQTAPSKKERRKLVDEVLVQAELADMADRDPATLSGGQKARVALMRVLLAEPRALLLDEPFSKLDAELRNQIRQFVFGEASKRNLPVLLVTHDREDAEAAGGDIITLAG